MAIRAPPEATAIPGVVRRCPAWAGKVTQAQQLPRAFHREWAALPDMQDRPEWAALPADIPAGRQWEP